MSEQAVITISTQIILDKWIDVLPDDATEEQIVAAAMKGAQDENCTWMAGSLDEKFKCGIGALAVHFKDDHEVFERMRREIAGLKALQAAISGVPVDFEAALGGEEFKPLGLNAAFHKAVAESKR